MRYKTITLVAIFSGALIAQTASSRPGAGSEANEAVTLLKAIRADAEQIQSSADKLERLAKVRDTNWQTTISSGTPSSPRKNGLTWQRSV